jgi:MFS family permease
LKKNILFYTLTAALGGLLFGFDTAVINGALPFFSSHFALDGTMQGWTVSSGLIGCVIGAILIGKPSDIFGSRSMLKFLAVLFVNLPVASKNKALLLLQKGFFICRGEKTKIWS